MNVSAGEDVAPGFCSAILRQPLEFSRSVHVQRHVEVVHYKIGDVQLRRMLYIARCCIFWCAQEPFDHLPPSNERVAMFAFEFRDDCPDSSLYRLQEMLLDRPHGCDLRRRSVYQRDYGSVAATIQDILQADFE